MIRVLQSQDTDKLGDRDAGYPQDKTEALSAFSNDASGQSTLRHEVARQCQARSNFIFSTPLSVHFSRSDSSPPLHDDARAAVAAVNYVARRGILQFSLEAIESVRLLTERTPIIQIDYHYPAWGFRYFTH